MTAVFVVGAVAGLLVGLGIRDNRFADPTVWGSVADWIGGLATAIAVGVAAVEIIASRRQEDRVQLALRAASAMAVAVTDVVIDRSGMSTVLRVTVENGGNLPVFECQVDLSDPDGWQCNTRIGTLGSAREKHIEVAANWRARTESVAWELRFRDSYGEVWRSRKGVVELIEPAPEFRS